MFDSALLRDDAVVVAVGSHEPDARELDAPLLGRATVVVEDVATALREAGDVVLAIAEGTLTAADLVPMRDVLTGDVAVPTDRPLVFKSVGMSWQDLVVAAAVCRGRGGYGGRVTRPAAPIHPLATVTTGGCRMMPNRLADATSPVPAAARGQPGRLVAVGGRGVRRGRGGGTCRCCSRVGYAACHWCHVMAHESFEDDGDRGAA